MKSNLKKILPLFFSVFVFSAIFIIANLKNSDKADVRLQLSPRSSLYREKYGEATVYEKRDVSSNSFVKNVRVNEMGGASEPKIVCNPKNKNVLVVSANDFSAEKNVLRIFVSEDSGMNWMSKDVNLSSKFNRSSYSDPWMDFDTEGNLYLTAVQSDLTKSGREGIFFARSSDNGNTWKTDFDFVDYNGKENIHLDRPKIYVSGSASNLNSIYVTWIEEKGFKTFIMLSKSLDGGITFSAPSETVKNDAEYCSVISNPEGLLYLTYLEDENKITIIKSSDDGISWSKEIGSIKISPAGIKSENQYVIKKNKNTSIRINSEPSVESNGKELLLTFSAAGRKNDLSDVYFVKFSFLTGEMTKPVRVNSDETLNDQYLPSIVADEKNIFIAYQDSRNDENNILTEAYVSVSDDGGLTFREEKLSTSSYNPLAISVDRYYGDYTSSVISGDKFISVWTDGRNNNLDVYGGMFDLKDFKEKKTD